MTPPGEAVAIAEVAVIGGEELLIPSLDIMESRSIVDLLGGVEKGETQKLDDVIQSISEKIGQTTDEVSLTIKKEWEDSANLLDPADKGKELTRVGRAAQKHASNSRGTDSWPPISGNASSMNEQGLSSMKDFLEKTADLTIRQGNRFNGFDIIDATGKGLRFDQNGNFVSFLDKDLK